MFTGQSIIFFYINKVKSSRENSVMNITNSISGFVDVNSPWLYTVFLAYCLVVKMLGQKLGLETCPKFLQDVLLMPNLLSI